MSARNRQSWPAAAQGSAPVASNQKTSVDPETYRADGKTHTLPPHAPGLRPLTDPALRGRAA
ncbi:hypothetical protein [Micromonospora haikouensis]|uniref:hypothetical protein n=1 Tax=Micromonospora haikouensis TaxID=686309 RepID=UPI003D747A6E